MIYSTYASDPLPEVTVASCSTSSTALETIPSSSVSKSISVTASPSNEEDQTVSFPPVGPQASTSITQILSASINHQEPAVDDPQDIIEDDSTPMVS